MKESFYTFRVFVQIDERNRIMNIDSDSFIEVFDGWIQIDEGIGDRYHHAQGNYFPGPKFDERGIPRYAYVPDGNPKWRERTQEEMDADYVPTEPDNTIEERLAFLEDCLQGIDQGIQDASE